jgi:DNA-binding SARP family transcriptional activator
VKEAGLIPEEEVRLCVIADGAKWIWKHVKALFSYAVQVLDYYHCSGHLHQVATVQFANDPEKQTEWAARNQRVADTSVTLDNGLTLRLVVWKILGRKVVRGAQGKPKQDQAGKTLYQPAPIYYTYVTSLSPDEVDPAQVVALYGQRWGIEDFFEQWLSKASFVLPIWGKGESVMAMLSVRLFGEFEIRSDGQTLVGIDARRVRELFCYLLIYRNRSHPRETLASLLWGDSSTAQSRKYLRQALWQLQAALDSQTEPGNDRVLLVEPDRVRLNPVAGLWLDVAVFEQACARVQDVPGQALDAPRVQALRDAVDLYRGDLLEGWFYDWCLYERERLQNMYLAILDKLMDHCEVWGAYEAGLAYGARILCCDHARERTHRRLMRLYYLAGDRTAALRQYDHCVEALRRELAVKPSARTLALYEQIRTERFVGPVQPPSPGTATRPSGPSPWREVLDQLRQLRTTLAEVHCQLEEGIQAVETIVNGQG